METIGDATLILGDCLEWLEGTPPCFRVDAVVADPPYGVGFKYATHDDRPESYEGGYGAWLWKRLEVAESRCTPGSPIFVWQSGPNLREMSKWFPRDWRLFVAAKNFVQMRAVAMQHSFDPVAVWWTPGEKPWSQGTRNRDFHIANTAPLIATPDNIEREHPCPRPIDQMVHIVTQWCKPGSIVLDPFMGSGSTGVACLRTGRRFIGIEIDPTYFDIACRRAEEAWKQPILFSEPQPEQGALGI